MVKITVVTVCFNSAKTLEQTIKSVINQTYTNIEYIIIDGGSTDGTLDIIKKYEQYISYWVSEPDNGIYDAMNKGISVATGELIAFINSDDWYDVDAMLHFVEAYKKHPADVLYGDVFYVNDDGSKQYESNRNINLDSMLYTNKLCHQGICVKTALMKKYNFDLRYKIAADYDFLLKLLIEGRTFTYIGDFLIAYFRRSGVSTNFVRETITEMDNIVVARSLTFLSDTNDEITVSKIKRMLELRQVYGIQQAIFKDIFYGRCKLVDNLEMVSNKYIIFGAGVVGKQLLKLLQNMNIKVKCFVDSDSFLTGKNVNGVLVCKPQDLLYNGHKIIISSYEYSDEMADILNKIGLKEKHDYYKFDTWVRWLSEHIEYIDE